MKPPRGQMCSACFSIWCAPSAPAAGQLLVAVLEQLLVTRTSSRSVIARRTTEPAPSAAISGASASLRVAVDLVRIELVVVEIAPTRGVQEPEFHAVRARAASSRTLLRSGRDTE